MNRIVSKQPPPSHVEGPWQGLPFAAATLSEEVGAELSFGVGDDGRLGHGDEEHQRTPKVIEALRGQCVVAIAGSGYGSLCTLHDGRMFGWGYGEDEMLGLQTTAHQLTPLEYPGLRVK